MQQLLLYFVICDIMVWSSEKAVFCKSRIAKEATFGYGVPRYNHMWEIFYMAEQKRKEELRRMPGLVWLWGGPRYIYLCMIFSTWLNQNKKVEVARGLVRLCVGPDCLRPFCKLLLMEDPGQSLPRGTSFQLSGR